MRTKNNPELCYWNDNNSADNIAVISGAFAYMVDKYGKITAELKHNTDITPMDDGVEWHNVTDVTELKVGYTYSIGQSELKLGKLTDEHIFGYCFLCFKPEGEIELTDMGYDEIVYHIRQGHVTRYAGKR